MGTVSPSIATGKALFEETTAFRAHDDAADYKPGGTYSHRPREFSATEAEEWCDWKRYVSGILLSGIASLKIRNDTGGNLPSATLGYAAGYDGTESRVLLGLADPADAAKPPQFVLLDGVDDESNGIAYGAVEVTGLDTDAASAVGDPVYLSATAGEWTFTPPTSIVYMVGVVTAKDATEGSILFFPARAVRTNDLPHGLASASAKTTPVDADTLGLTDSEDSSALKKITVANVWNWIVAKVQGLSAKTTPVDADILTIQDSEDSSALKELTVANLRTMLHAAPGALGGTTPGSAVLTTLRLTTSAAPASAVASGTAGDLAWDSGYLYLCIATDTWVRAELLTWS